MRLRTILLIAVGTMASVGGYSALALETLASPIQVEFFLTGEKEKFGGKLVSHDAAGFALTTPSGEQAYTWDQLTPSSAFTVKFRLIDKTIAGQWLDLGRWGWEHGLNDQSKSAFAQARRLDASLAAEIDAIVAIPAGSALVAAPTAPPAEQDAPAATQPTGAPGAPDATAPADEPAMQPVMRDPGEFVLYGIPTAQEHAASIALSRKRMREAEQTLGITLHEIETDHFLIYTDWDAREYEFLRRECERAYKLVATQFRQPVTGNVFVGKLPMYMFKSQADFRRFASEMDEFDAPETVLGYFVNSQDIGHMAMWKPGIGSGIGAGGSLNDAMRKWGRTLIHEFTHAFIYRYKSNARIPRWLNEGTAEMVSEATLPSNNYHAKARTAALQNVDIMSLFDDLVMPGGYYYPVMMTMAECLQKQDSKKFLALFDEIKSGTEPEEALKKVYGINYVRLAEGWNKYARGLR